MRIDKEPLPLPGTVEDPLYPGSDGEPMGEGDLPTQAVLVLREALEDFYAVAGRTDVYIASNMLLYYEQGVTNARREPTCWSPSAPAPTRAARSAPSRRADCPTSSSRSRP